MTKAQVMKQFRSEFWATLKGLQGDRIAKNELFWGFADSLCKSRIITEHQFNTWSNPF